MMVFPFERSGDLMTVTARVWGAHEYRELILVIDTGAAATSIEPAILKELGYSSRDAILRTRVDGLLGMNFLENYNFTVRPRDRQIHLESVTGMPTSLVTSSTHR